MGRSLCEGDGDEAERRLRELENDSKRFDDYYNHIYLEEQPYYRVGMNKEEATIEQSYLNENIDSFVRGKYIPLWKQNLISTWFK